MKSPPPPCSVLVSSCDAYRDIWPVFFRLYFKHAEGLKMPVRLVADQCSYADERVEMLHTGEDPSWTTSLARALEQSARTLCALPTGGFFAFETDQHSTLRGDPEGSSTPSRH
jgi:hypothetical protein